MLKIVHGKTIEHIKSENEKEWLYMFQTQYYNNQKIDNYNCKIGKTNRTLHARFKTYHHKSMVDIYAIKTTNVTREKD